MDIFLKNDLFKNIKDEMLEMLEQHFIEVSPFNGIEKFDPEVKYYDELEESGTLKLFTVYADDKLVGYNAYSLFRHPHVNVLFASQDVIYIKPEFRKHGLGSKLIEFSDIMLKQYGAKYVINTVNSVHDYSSVFEKHGYKKLDLNFIKGL